MIIFFEKLEWNFVSDQRYDKRDDDIYQMFVEVEIIWWFWKNSSSNFCESKRKRFMNTHAINSEYSNDNQQSSYDKYWHESISSKIKLLYITMLILISISNIIYQEFSFTYTPTRVHQQHRCILAIDLNDKFSWSFFARIVYLLCHFL